MKQAKQLLEYLTQKMPPGKNQHHNIIVENGHLVVTLMCGDLYHPFMLEDEDFDKPAEILADELVSMLTDKAVIFTPGREGRYPVDLTMTDRDGRSSITEQEVVIKEVLPSQK